MQYVAFDLGAGSGRVMLGTLREGHVSLEEIHRFPDPAVCIDGADYWQILRIYDELREGLRRVAARGVVPRSVSADSWGVDYVLIKDPNPMVCPPFQYRDVRTEGWMEKLDQQIGLNTIYQETGIQHMPFNTIFQLAAHRHNDPATVDFAQRFLGIGDYINYLFSGVARMEVSLASTTALYNPQTRDWSEKLIHALSLPRHLFPEIVASGTVLGPLRFVSEGWQDAKVVASCSHDTGAAVAAVPVVDDGKSWAYLSSGTWSLLGAELEQPVINEDSARLNYTNEIGFNHTVRFLKNISGLFVIQELRAEWAKQGVDYDFAKMTEMAAAAPAFAYFIDPNHPNFATTGDMVQKIRSFCAETNQTAPTDHGALLRGVFESLALYYRIALKGLSQVTGREFQRLHIVGGGSKNELLNQFASDALGIEVVAGPDEATALGNILIQAVADKEVSGLVELRRIVAASVPTRVYEPGDTRSWDAAFQRFEKLCR